MKRIRVRISTLMLLVVIAALFVALVALYDRVARLEAELGARTRVRGIAIKTSTKSFPAPAV